MEENLIVYQKDVNVKNIMKFVFPTIIMSLIQVLYTTIDGIFISQYVGTDAMASLTLLAPYISVLFSVSAMLASGGCAVVMKKMGEKKEREAKEDFSAFICINFFIGIVFMIIGIFFTSQLVEVFNASKIVTTYCNDYLFYYALFAIPLLLMNNLQVYVVAANSPLLAFSISLIAGITNVILDYLFVGVFSFGVKGAAIATGISNLLPMMICIIYFSSKKRLLHFVKPVFRLKETLKAITNGVSELATTIATGLTALLMNIYLMKYAGENGVASYTIIYYIFTVMTAIYMGYVYGVAPMISYYHGNSDHVKLKKLNKISLIFILVISVISTILSLTLGKYLIAFFVSSGTPVYSLAVYGNQIFSFALLTCGFGIYFSGMFTALSNGLISALIAFGRTFLFIAGSLFVLPRIFEITGVWLASPIAEFLGCLLGFLFFIKLKQKYHY
jgi:Na+-driven multidrug efflux pump